MDVEAIENARERPWGWNPRSYPEGPSGTALSQGVTKLTGMGGRDGGGFGMVGMVVGARDSVLPCGGRGTGGAVGRCLGASLLLVVRRRQRPGVREDDGPAGANSEKAQRPHPDAGTVVGAREGGRPAAWRCSG